MMCFDRGGPGIELVEYFRLTACHLERNRSALEATTARSRQQHPATAPRKVICNIAIASPRALGVQTASRCAKEKMLSAIQEVVGVDVHVTLTVATSVFWAHPRNHAPALATCGAALGPWKISAIDKVLGRARRGMHFAQSGVVSSTFHRCPPPWHRTPLATD